MRDDVDRAGAPVVEALEADDFTHHLQNASRLTRRERSAAQSERDRAAHEARKRPDWLPACPRGAKLIPRGCGHQQAALAWCGSPLCPECERARAGRIREKWLPTLAELPELKMLTLTIASGPDLAERIGTLYEARRRLLDLRLGRNNRAKIGRAVNEKIARILAAGKISQERADQWRAQSARWLEAVARIEQRGGKSPKVRAIVKGLTFLEVTHTAAGWHAHLHCLVSMRYMPQIVLTVLWRMATRGAGYIADIRKITDAAEGLTEVAKYVTKPSSITTERQAREVLEALRGVKRVTRIGTIKPTKPEPIPCPGCGAVGTCACFYAGTVTLANIEIGNIEHVTYRLDNYYDAKMGMSYPAFIQLRRNEKGNLIFHATPCAGAEMVLSTYSPSVSREGGAAPPGTAPPSAADCMREVAAIRRGLK